MTPGQGETHEQSAQSEQSDYSAIYADLGDNAAPSYRDTAGSAVVLNEQSAGSVSFVIQANGDGYYLLRLHYAVPSSGAAQRHVTSLGLVVDREQFPDIVLASSGSTPHTEIGRTVFLSAGIHLVQAKTVPRPDGGSIELNSLDLLHREGPIATYEAGNEQNGFAANFLQFNSVMAKAPDHYRMIVTYCNSDMGHKGQIDAYSAISVNNQSAATVYFRNTFDPGVFATSVIDIDLKAGANSIRFSYPAGEGPVIQRIEIAARETDRM